jgi:hypothetical protein
MGPTLVTKAVLALLALPLTCMALCTSRVQPVHGWMMRHHCPLAGLAMHPPSRPIGVQRRSDEQHARMTIPARMPRAIAVH